MTIQISCRRAIGLVLVLVLAFASCADGSRSLMCPLTDCSGVCVDTAVDRNNCGACGMTCTAGEVCSAGTCELSCPVGLVKCGGTCIDPTTDREHCGASGTCEGSTAGTVCDAGEICDGSGTCSLSCQAGLVACGGNCVDPGTDEAHCGATGDCAGANAGDTCVAGEVCNGAGVCAVSCGTGLMKCNGACIDPDSDPVYCGATGACTGYSNCSGDEACVQGACLEFIPPCTLYVIEFGRQISRVNKLTGTLTSVSTADPIVGGAAGLAYRPDTATVYLTSSTNDSLYTINLMTGAATLVGAYGIDVTMHGLEWSQWNHKLYGMSDDDLYTINVTTGAATLVGSTGIAGFSNLGFDSRNGVMIMTNSTTDSAYALNLNTAGATLLGPLNTMTNPHSLAYDAENGVMYVLDSSDNELGTLNRTTGAVTPVGLTGAVNLLGMVCAP
jgi:hypothetical protein